MKTQQHPNNTKDNSSNNNESIHRCSELEFPNVDRLDAENAHFCPEHRIPHAKLYVYGQLERSTFCELIDFLRNASFNMLFY